jgi:transposase InsO family protein
VPWEERHVVVQRRELVEELLRGERSVAAIAREFRVSRTTAYKWIDRFEEGGRPGLSDKSRAPKSNPRATSAETITLVLDKRREVPSWGPRKLRASLQREHPQLEIPAASTIGEILTRHGLTNRRRGRPPARPKRDGPPLRTAAEPNDLWCTDFKGHFMTRDRKRCTPLTITDQCSRFLIRCHGLRCTRAQDVKPVFESAFREFGLPRAIRSDNGTPFAAAGLLGLSELAIWWLKLGIELERIQPGKPQQNGRHERMHLTLANETEKNPAANLLRQQQVFDVFRKRFNEDRPHEALGQRTPREFYAPSPRPFPRHLSEPHYHASWHVRRVDCDGGINWRGRWLRVGAAFRRELVALEPVDDGVWSVRFLSLVLGTLEERASQRSGGRTLGTPLWKLGPSKGPRSHSVVPQAWSPANTRLPGEVSTMSPV